jgi:hypothetical protein
MVSGFQSMELAPLNIRFNNLTNYNYHITPDNLYSEQDNQTNQEGWGFFSLNRLMNNENIFLNNENISVNNENIFLNNENISVNNENIFLNNENISVNNENISVNNENISVNNENISVNNDYDPLEINGKGTVFFQEPWISLQQSVDPSIPTQVAPAGATYWNGNTCFYSSGDPNSSMISEIKQSYGKTFFGNSKNGNVKLIDPNSDKVYTFFSNLCNKKTCIKSNLNGINADGFTCLNAEATQLASNAKNTLWKNGKCFYKPVDFQKTSSFYCYYPNAGSSTRVQFSHYLDKQLKNDNTDDNFFCYPYVFNFKNFQQEDCVKEKLNLFVINSADFFLPKQLTQSFIWDGDHNRCFYYDGVETNANKIFYYGNLPHMYSHHSNHLSCTINSCQNNKITPTANGFSCSLTASLSNWNLDKVIDKVMVKQSTDPSIPTDVAPADSAYWNGNICFYSNADPSSGSISLIEQSYYKIYLDSSFSGALDPNSDKLYTYYSNVCNKKTCTTDNLKNLGITNNNFVCPAAENTQLASSEKNTLWKNSYCFYKPVNFTSSSAFDCYYPDYFSTNNNLFNDVSYTQLINNNIDDNFFCYPYLSANIEPQDCIKEKLDLFPINSNDFFIPKQLQLNLVWDGNYNRCFYYDGSEINANKIFYYGNLPYMYSHHSNDLSCNIKNCKNAMTISSNQNQFQCQNIDPNPTYSIKTYYTVNFSMIEGFFNAIGSFFKIPSMDTLHWAIYYPLMVILYPLNPWLNVFVEPWINFANSRQLFSASKNLISI